jgi:hypothetical protein
VAIVFLLVNYKQDCFLEGGIDHHIKGLLPACYPKVASSTHLISWTVVKWGTFLFFF